MLRLLTAPGWTVPATAMDAEVPETQGTVFRPTAMDGGRSGLLQ
jgi:hypothetical protein